jgi:hypothetical protein
MYELVARRKVFVTYLIALVIYSFVPLYDVLTAIMYFIRFMSFICSPCGGLKQSLQVPLSGSTAHEPDKIIQKYINIKNYHIPVLLFEIEIALKFAVVSWFGTDTLFLFPLHHLLLSST